MNKKRNLILTILIAALLIAALLIGLLVWRLTPRSLESLTGLDFDRAVSLSAHTRTALFEFESGHPVFVHHKLDNEDTVAGTEHFDPMLELFRNVEARPSLSNLLRPWLISNFSWTGPVDFLYGFVSCGDTATNFELTNRGELTVGQHMYYITDEDQFNALWDYVTTHGIENKS